VAQETEIKIALSGAPEFVEKLLLLKPAIVADRHFEDNFVLDFSDGRLRDHGCLMRVRKTQHKESVTFKGPPVPSMRFKSREEWETQIDNAETMLAILGQLGMKTWFRYQKYRQEYSISTPGEPGHEVIIALDVTPVGDFAELEGAEADIRALAVKLGIEESQFLRDSYYMVYTRFCHEQGREPGNMVF
jgi:adenylate cyclase class 2